MKKILLPLLLLLLAWFPVQAVTPPDYATLNSFEELLVSQGVETVEAFNAMTEEEKQKLVQLEFNRRSRKYSPLKYTVIPGPMHIYPTETREDDKALINPTCEYMKVIDMTGTMIKVYVPYFDKVGYFDRFETCGYRGMTIKNWDLVNFIYYSNGVTGFTNGTKIYTFPLQIEWGDEQNLPLDANITATTGAPPDSNSTTENPPAVDPPATDSDATSPTETTSTPPTTDELVEITDSDSARNMNETDVTVRTGKDSESEVAFTLPAGAVVKVLENDGNWCKVEYEGQTGWMRAFYLGLDEKANPELANAHSEGVHLREEKNVTSQCPVVIPPGAKIRLLKHDGDWLKVVYKGMGGYMRTKYSNLEQ